MMYELPSNPKTPADYSKTMLRLKMCVHKTGKMDDFCDIYGLLMWWCIRIACQFYVDCKSNNVNIGIYCQTT